MLNISLTVCFCKKSARLDHVNLHIIKTTITKFLQTISFIQISMDHYDVCPFWSLDAPNNYILFIKMESSVNNSLCFTGKGHTGHRYRIVPSPINAAQCSARQSFLSKALMLAPLARRRLTI